MNSPSWCGSYVEGMMTYSPGLRRKRWDLQRALEEVNRKNSFGMCCLFPCIWKGGVHNGKTSHHEGAAHVVVLGVIVLLHQTEAVLRVGPENGGYLGSSCSPQRSSPSPSVPRSQKPSTCGSYRPPGRLGKGRTVVCDLEVEDACIVLRVALLVGNNAVEKLLIQDGSSADLSGGRPEVWAWWNTVYQYGSKQYLRAGETRRLVTSEKRLQGARLVPAHQQLWLRILNEPTNIR
ncbi:hypothetical protein FQN60_007172 [Etheostoma spectabile]|uniref:Uncharacterized protein n=1 Tax=Etheostoma spectabile TaxID=54343 RepID=A0A5J5CFY4_9PERO|nr:hypothetical protein FQN60_007172 [Etheostoma spectabile]